MPKEQIHWAKKQFRILKDSQRNCCVLSTPSATFTQKSLQDLVSVPVQIQDTYEWQATFLRLQNVLWHSWIVLQSRLQNLQPQSRCGTFAEEPSQSLVTHCCPIYPDTALSLGKGSTELKKSHRAELRQCLLDSARTLQQVPSSWGFY